MREEDETGVGAEPGLLHGADRDPAVAEDLRDRGEHAGPVDDTDREVEGAPHLAGRHQPRRGRDGRRAPDHAGRPVPRGDREVAEHRGRGGRTPRPPALQHERAEPVALDEDRVRRPVHRGERVRRGDHRGMHAHRDVDANALGDREQPHHVAHPPGRVDVLERHLGDPDARDVGVGHLRAEGERREDRRLLGRVVPVEVGGRVTLGEPQRRGRRERLVELAPLPRHRGEQEVGRAVHDPEHALDRLARERVPKHSHDRDRPGDRGLVEEVDLAACRELGELAQPGGEQRLVRRHHRAARLEGLADQPLDLAEPADELDDDVGCGGDQRARVRRDERGAETVAGDALAGDGDADQLERRTGRLREGGGRARVEHRAGDLGADGPAPEQRDADGVAHRAPQAHSSDARSSRVSRRSTVRGVPSRTNTTAGRPTRLYVDAIEYP